MNSVEKLDIIPEKLSIFENIQNKYAYKICAIIKQGKKLEHPLGKIITTLLFLVEIFINTL